MIQISPKITTDNHELVEYSQALRTRYPLQNHKVLLVQTLQLQLDSFNLEVARNKGCYAYPPTGLQCLMKALAPRKNVEVCIFDLNYHFLKRVVEEPSFSPLNWLDLLEEHLQTCNPSIVGVTCIGVSTDLMKATHPLTAVLRHLISKNKYIVMAGGPVATNAYKEYLSEGLCHFVITGEGEDKLNFLLDHLLAEEVHHDPTPGIFFKSNGHIQQTHGLERTPKLEGNLIDSYKTIPIENYNQVGSLNPFSRMAGREKRFSCIQLNRGCRANCKFCGVPSFMGAGVRQFPYQELLDELVYLIERRGVLHFELLDDDFLGPLNLREGVIELLKKMCELRERYPITWSAGNGLIAASVDEKLVELIYKSGCIGFAIGIESGNEQMLKRMRKPASKPALLNFANRMKKYPSVFVRGNYIIGLFGDETFGEMLDSFHFSQELAIDWAAYSIFQFTSTATIEKENLKPHGKAATDFVPVKDFVNRELSLSEEKLIVGMDIFNIPKESIPSRNQLKEIWYTFNFLSNYIYNKNLKPEGNPEKLARWLDAIHVTYPKNPYILLFAALAYLLVGDRKSAEERTLKAKANLSSSPYWIGRFEQFRMMDLIHHFPTHAEEVYSRLDEHRHRLTPKEAPAGLLS